MNSQLWRLRETKAKIAFQILASVTNYNEVQNKKHWYILIANKYKL